MEPNTVWAGTQPLNHTQSTSFDPLLPCFVAWESNATGFHAGKYRLFKALLFGILFENHFLRSLGMEERDFQVAEPRMGWHWLTMLVSPHPALAAMKARKCFAFMVPSLVPFWLCLKLGSQIPLGSLSTLPDYLINYTFFGSMSWSWLDTHRGWTEHFTTWTPCSCTFD